MTAPAAETPAEPVAEEPAAEEPAPAAEVTAEPAADTADTTEDAAPRRTRRRASRRASAPAGAPAADVTAETEQAAPTAEEAPVTENDTQDETPAETSAAQTPRPPPRRPASPPARRPQGRRRVRRARAPRPRRRGRGQGGRPAPSRASRRRGVPAAGVHRAPLPDPERAAAEAAAGLAEAVEPEEETEELPEEQPAASRRRRRRKGASDEPEATAPAAVEETPEADAEDAAEQAEDRTDGADDTDEGDDHDDTDDHEASGSRRRRRRGGRRQPARRVRGRRRRRAAGRRGHRRAVRRGRRGHRRAVRRGRRRARARGAREDNGGSSSSRRRRRRRRRAGDSGGEPEPSADDPERTVVKVREPRPKPEPSDEVQSIKGSTRLEAKKQRRREGREQGRRRVPIITEAEFLARREAVERVMVVRQHGDRTQIGVLEDGVLVEHYVNKEQATSYVGNVYLGKVQNVLPSMEAAFIDIGKGRNAVLYAGEVNFEALGMSGGPRRIESALKSGQPVLVQVTKDPIGHKGARLTSQVSLPGRYLVYVPEGSMTGISRKLPDTERSRLKTILKKIVPEDAGVIVRTAAEGASEDELRRDVERLQAQWEEIKKKSKNGGTAPTLLYGEPDMTVRVVRDIFNEDFSKVVVSGDEAWETIHGYVSHVAPDLAERLSRWTSEVDVFATYRIDEQLAKALDRKVWLPSGGSLVIDRTEAMVVIDVNTGKFTGQGGNLEETVTRNNLEAAEEIVRQLRLRDLGGIIVIDFIDMVLESNRDLVLRRLLECLGRDRTKHQVAEVTSLGLVQMTRKRVGQGLLESFSETCVHCNGRGVIVHLDQPSSVGGGKRRKRARAKRGGPAARARDRRGGDARAGGRGRGGDAYRGRRRGGRAAAALPAPEFTPDEELYSSAAEAEAAASPGRTRRRASRRASAPAGSPGRESARGGRRQAEEAPVVEETPTVPTAQDVTAAEEAERPVQPETAAEALAERPPPRTSWCRRPPRRPLRRAVPGAGPPARCPRRPVPRRVPRPRW